MSVPSNCTQKMWKNRRQQQVFLCALFWSCFVELRVSFIYLFILLYFDRFRWHYEIDSIIFIEFSSINISFIPKILHFISHDKIVSFHLTCFFFWSKNIPKNYSIRFQFKPLSEIHFTQKTTTISHPIDFDQIMQKSYKKISELLIDIEWFAYNCVSSTQDSSIKLAASKLVKYFLEDINSIVTCEECYCNAFAKGESSFLIPCEQPHLLVWADAGDYGFWPAKAMKVNEKTINLRFFGDHTTENLPFDSCFLYSKERPDDTRVSTLEN